MPLSRRRIRPFSLRLSVRRIGVAPGLTRRLLSSKENTSGLLEADTTKLGQATKHPLQSLGIR